jgi:hypothetical protein
MKKYFACILTVAVLSCNNSPKVDENTSVPAESKMEALYDFSITSDHNFCSPDSIIGTDCGGGEIYFTKNGTVFYTVYCMGYDTTTYEIGKYVISADSNIACTFDRSYSFYNGYNDDAVDRPFDVNSGKIVNEKLWKVELKKLSCKPYSYGFINDDMKQNYVLSKPDKDMAKIFFDEYGKIKVFTGL